MKTGTNAEPWWWKTGVSANPDGFLPAKEVLKGLPTREEFGEALDGALEDSEDAGGESS